MTDNDLNSFLREIGVFNTELFRHALTHSSMGKDNNERLEFLGNSVLNFVVAESLFLERPNCDEGQLSCQCNYLRSDYVLVKVGAHLNLPNLISFCQGDVKSVTDDMLAGAVEAIIGAIYLQAGIKNARAFVFRYILTEENLSASKNYKDPITVLKEHCEKKRLDIKKDEEMVVVDRSPVHCVKLSLGTLRTVGQGNRKKTAERMAASALLAQLNQPG